MTLQNIVVNGTDTLGQGVELHEVGYRHTGYRFAISVRERDVIAGSFAEFDRHLNRLLGRADWTYESAYAGNFDRRYYFRSQFAVELESVPAEKPAKPSAVAALVGKDPYTTPGDIDFLLKGDRFRAERSRPGGRKEVVYGTAAMSGNAISENHGWLMSEAAGDTRTAQAKRNAYEGTDRAYINVHFDHREPGHYDAGVRADSRGKGYVPQGKGWPNEGLCPRDGWQIWVLPEVAKRKTKALADAKRAADKVKAEQGLDKARNAVKAAEAALARAQRELSKLS